jgi:hypothetical protein
MNAIATICGIFFCVSIFCASLSAQELQKPKELEVLGQYVGDWTSDVTNNPAVWNTEEQKLNTTYHAEFVLDGWVLQHIEVNHVVGSPENVTKALMVSSYDAQSSKYVTWWFQSSGNMGHSNGKWDANRKSLILNAVDPPPNTTATFIETFPDKSTIQGSVVFTEDDNRKLFDMEWTRTRLKDLAPTPMHKQWAEIDTPIQPLPPETKKLKAFIGEWDAEFVHRPSTASPNGDRSKGSMTAQWILDGRFLYGQSEVGNHKSMWIIGYDTNLNTYRYVRFTNAGVIQESKGRWDDETRSFVWKLVNSNPSITRTSTNRVMGEDGIHAHILAEDGDGKIHLDLKIRSTRRT